MEKSKNPQVNRAEKHSFRLSQCMIVKNEEENIELALSWARNIAFEQIVVDTGSSDRTVEIAERMGAKVYHFEWINDFAAAKNYAIEKASGDWIAFLDADEYFCDDDANKLLQLIDEINNDTELRKRVHMITTSWMQVTESGMPCATIKHQRVFRNLPEIRYFGRIHESLTVNGENIEALDLCIIHTGYTKVADNISGRERNIALLNAELEQNPNDPNLLIYLADTIKSSCEEKDYAEAERLFMKALNGKQAPNHKIKQLAYQFLVPRFTDKPDEVNEALKLCLEATQEYPENLDFIFYYGKMLNVAGDYSRALEVLQRCESALREDKMPLAQYLLQYPVILFQQLAIAEQGLDDLNGMVKYTTLALREDKSQIGMLKPYIMLLKTNHIPDSEVIGLLQKLYDFTSVKDKLFIVRAAKDVGAISLAKTVMAMITEEEKAWLSSEK